MIFIFFTGLGPGGLRKSGRFLLDRVCIPGSSHGGIAMRLGYAIYSDQVYDQQDTVSLLGGSGGEINHFKNTQCGSDLSANEGCSGNWLIGGKQVSLGTLQLLYLDGILTTTNQSYIRRINCVLTTFY